MEGKIGAFVVEGCELGGLWTRLAAFDTYEEAIDYTIVTPFNRHKVHIAVISHYIPIKNYWDEAHEDVSN